MAKICLPKNIVQVFKQALKSGRINPDQLSSMTSGERNKFFKDMLGKEYATLTNSLFESKLLLKNQKQGLINWAKTAGNLKPEIKRDLLSKIEKMDKVLDTADTDGFLSDLASTKLGVNITDKEASTITSLAKEATDARHIMESKVRREIGEGPTQEELEYGLKTIGLNDFVNNLKIKAEQRSIKELILNPLSFVTEVASITKSITSSIDNSVLGRQGIKTLFSNTSEYLKNAPKTFRDILDTFKGKDTVKQTNAEIISDPMYDLMKKSKLAVGAIEEAFPTRSPEKIPGLGTFFKASDAAYSNFLHRMRADLFKKYIKIAEEARVNINDIKQTEAIAKMVNSLTGRGYLGSLEKNASIVNTVFFSPRLMKSNIDFLTGHNMQQGVTPFVRKQAAISLVKTVVGVGAVLATASRLFPDSVETDPRSSDFGKIKIEKTRFDVAGGMAGYTTLLARLITNSKKSSSSGKITELGKGYKPETRYDILLTFFENKFSPVTSEVKQRLEGKTFDGEDPAVINSILGLITPLSLASIYETKDETERADLLVIAISEALGIGTQTY